MCRKLFLMALLGLSFAACKPTQRKVSTPRRHAEQKQDGRNPVQQPATPEQVDPTPQGQGVTGPVEPEPVTPVLQGKTPPAPAQPEPVAPDVQSYSDCLLEVSSVTQEYNIITPWEKNNPSGNSGRAIYMGNGLALVSGDMLKAATYVELGLPDGSRTVTARVVKYDADLGLGLLSLAHEEDASIFDSRRAFPIGEPMRLGDTAELWYLVNDTMPAKVDLLAQSGNDSMSVPQLDLKPAQAVAEQDVSGAPVIRDGKLVGMVRGGNGGNVTCVNAEILKRFMDEDPKAAATGMPVFGIRHEPLSPDPVFRRYLRLKEGQTGLYISKVLPHSAAASAGLLEGDVITAVEGMPVDALGRCNHPVYGPVGAMVMAKSLKPAGQSVVVTIARAGESMDVQLPLDCEAREKSLWGTDKPGVQPRYIMWGGILFQVVTNEYLQQRQDKPVHLLELQRREKELQEAGVTEAVVLSGVIPTPATLGYEGLGGCLVEKVNGKPIRNFAEFEEALDAPTRDGIVEISINCAPYTIYVDVQMAEAANDALRRNAIHTLRHTGEVK